MAMQIMISCWRCVVGIQNGAVRSAVQPRDFVVVTGCDRAVFEIAAGETVSKVLAIDIPAEVSYPLLHK